MQNQLQPFTRETFVLTNARYIRLKPSAQPLCTAIPDTIKDCWWGVALVRDIGVCIILPNGCCLFTWEDLRIFFEYLDSDGQWRACALVERHNQSATSFSP